MPDFLDRLRSSGVYNWHETRFTQCASLFSDNLDIEEHNKRTEGFKSVLIHNWHSVLCYSDAYRNKNILIRSHEAII